VDAFIVLVAGFVFSLEYLRKRRLNQAGMMPANPGGMPVTKKQVVGKAIGS
jgi:hypothetical protein